MTRPETYDVVGVGFGPANLALAIAVDEHNAKGDRPLRAMFLERQAGFGWHRGMLFDDATMQVSFLKDLVTQRNPASDFSFVSYLHERDRLSDFINFKTLYPLRTEFHDYLEWAAARMDHAVTYDAEVVDVVPVRDGAGRVVALDVHARTADGEPSVVRARHVVVAPGLELRLPAGARITERIWHNLDLLGRVAAFDEPAPQRLVVVGAGQSAAEAVGYLHRRFPTAQICSVFLRYGFSPADDSPFANRIFDPEAVDTYFDAPDDVKRMLFDYHRNTNYSVVDMDLIEDLYRRIYAERVEGRERLRLMGITAVTDVVEGPDGVRVTVEHLPTGKHETLDADVLVYATGYRPVPAARVLGEAAALCRYDAAGHPVLARDYSVHTHDDVDAGVYLQGGTEPSHGITSTLLSNLAVRAGEITRSVAARLDAAEPDLALLVPDAAAGVPSPA